MSYDSLFNKITLNYNKAIELCKDPMSYNALTSEYVCGIEIVLGKKVTDRLSNKHKVLAYDEDPKVSIDKQMCGCRVSATVIFTMIHLSMKHKLIIDKPVGSFFHDEYTKLFRSQHINIVNQIVGVGITKDDFQHIGEKKYDGIFSDLSKINSTGLFLVQILKLVDYPFDYGDKKESHHYTTQHTFVLYIEPSEQCTLLSSWFLTNSSLATPLSKQIETLEHTIVKKTQKCCQNKTKKQ